MRNNTISFLLITIVIGITMINNANAQVFGTGSANIVAKWVSGTNIGNSQIFDDGTYVGIGTTFPAAKLQVAGNINTTFDIGYLINGASALGVIDQNVLTGPGAGGTLTTGDNNTYNGSYTGQEIQSGSNNTGVGAQADFWNRDGDNNTAAGAFAGFGANGYNHSNNCFFGYMAGYSNTNGGNNTMIGSNADNLGAPSITNATAIGSNAIVKASDNMILGDLYVNIGVGLSGVLGGALAKLHVQRDPSGTRTPITDPTAVFVENNDVDKDGDYNGNAYGIRVRTLGANLFNYGGHFKAENATINTAGRFEATSIAAINSGGYFIAANAEESNIGLSSHALDGQLSEGGIFSGSNAVTNFGVDATADAALNNDYNFGVKGLANPGRNTIFNVGVLGEAPVNSPDPSAGLGTWAVYAD